MKPKPNCNSKPKSLIIALLICGAAWAAGPSSRWEINLERDITLQSFDRPLSAAWTEQQGILFLTPRSEEHTSELQSLTNIVFRLLLEIKTIPACPSLLASS